jgi:hydroxyacyl-ACP dehydratase HTD2-like protein with hotdog domain
VALGVPAGPLRTGAEATRRTWQASAARKQGRSGPLVFVTVRTEVSQGGQVVITEEQDLVYREAGADSPGRSGHSVAAAGRSEYSYRLVAPLYEDDGLIVSATATGLIC